MSEENNQIRCEKHDEARVIKQHPHGHSDLVCLSCLKEQRKDMLDSIGITEDNFNHDKPEIDKRLIQTARELGYSEQALNEGLTPKPYRCGKVDL